jgi:cell wall-associated NlpC family hydrolase/peptidoglycan hydrolase CwlO-like protein
MPRRASMFVFLGLAVALVLVTGVSAGAAPDGSIRAKKADVAEAQDRLMEIRMQASAAEASYNNALYEMNQLNEKISGTRDHLEDAKERVAESKESLEERAAQVYKSGNVAFMDVLVGVDNFSEFAARLDLWVRLLDRERTEFLEFREARNQLAERRARLVAEREQRVDAVETAIAQKERADKAEARAEAYLNSLNAELREAIGAAQDRQVAQARAAVAAVVEKAPEPKTVDEPEPIPEVEVSQVEQAPVPRADLQSEQAAAERQAAAQAAAEKAQQLAERRAAERQAAREAAEQAAQQAAAEREAARMTRMAAEKEAREEAQRQAELAAQRAAERQAAREEAQREAQREAERAARRAAIEEAAAEQAAAEREAARMAAERRAKQQAAEERAAQRAEASAAASAAAAEEAAAEQAAAEQAAKEQAAKEQAAKERAAEQRAAEASASASASAPSLNTSRRGGGGNGANAAPFADATASAPVSGSRARGGGGGGVGGSGYDVLSVAQEHLGTPYRLSPPAPCIAFKSEDCSCFTMLVFQEFGIALPDSPGGQMGYGTPVHGAPQAGDLLFWSENGSGVITHVGIAMGDGTTIHAQIGNQVTTTPINYIRGYVGARRLL